MERTLTHEARGAARGEAPQIRRAGAAGGVRTDIQGLRAIAVALVLVFHLVPPALPGGYVGVDVFFVISGFLITGQLLREMEAGGSVNLPRFWARRARRLLPAALLVLGATLLAVWIMAPSGFVPSFLLQLAASAAYVQNWVLAAESVDYMADEAQVSPVQHYWSLSVEEQFYIVWPVVALAAVLLAAWAARRRERPGGGARPGRPGGSGRPAPSARLCFGILIGAVALASFATSIAVTAFDPAQAYFVTTTRAWEFAAGGLLALLATSAADPLARLSPAVRSAMAWAGLAGIGVSAALFTGGTPFPGWVALLPVVATALVVAAGEPRTRWAPTALLAARPMQWLGDVSYGAYLWHFPIIVLVPFVLGRPMGVLDWGAIVAATLLLAWLSKILVEDPFRTGAARSWTNGRTLAITTGAMGIMLALSLVGVDTAEKRIDTARDEVSAALQDPDTCVGLPALDPDSGCDPEPAEPPIPDPSLADKAPERCLSPIQGSELRVCEYGAKLETADRAIALVGDSHAEQWLGALERVADRENWSLLVMAKASCPFIAGDRDFDAATEAGKRALQQDCADWNERAVEKLEDTPQIDTVITSAKSTNRIVAVSGKSWRESAREAYAERWAALPESVRHVVAIRDTPQMPGNVLRCVTENGAEASRACAVPEQEAFHEDPLAEAAEVSQPARVSLVDLSDYFVVDDEASPVIGGVLAFRDSHHLSWAYSEVLAEPLGEEITGVLEPEPAPEPAREP
ncbi:acyltransferase [Leucobacter sp. CSA1]|uniref:Acyltransferase n=1 Tax=Leucobacter chromiisoli TaxID=2796471 RepID=A0A934UVL9_9MICO|nr:acyltransferase family protein [Leucobacter chromiisoli]MBK0419616.1 acyltransferase [Leucobacter chromiisoli]